MDNAKNLVETYNLLNQYAPTIITMVKAQLDPFIGKPIFKNDGSWRKAVNFQHVEIKQPVTNGYMNIHCWLKPEYGYVRLYIKICYNGGNHDDRTNFCIYQETSIDLYTLDKDDNITLIAPDYARFDVRFDLAVMQAQADKAKEFAKQLEKEISLVPWQFRDVLDVPRLR